MSGCRTTVHRVWRGKIVFLTILADMFGLEERPLGLERVSKLRTPPKFPGYILHIAQFWSNTFASMQNWHLKPTLCTNDFRTFWDFRFATRFFAGKCYPTEVGTGQRPWTPQYPGFIRKKYVLLSSLTNSAWYVLKSPEPNMDVAQVRYGFMNPRKRNQKFSMFCT